MLVNFGRSNTSSPVDLHTLRKPPPPTSSPQPTRAARRHIPKIPSKRTHPSVCRWSGVKPQRDTREPSQTLHPYTRAHTHTHTHSTRQTDTHTRNRAGRRRSPCGENGHDTHRPSHHITTTSLPFTQKRSHRHQQTNDLASWLSLPPTLPLHSSPTLSLSLCAFRLPTATHDDGDDHVIFTHPQAAGDGKRNGKL